MILNEATIKYAGYDPRELNKWAKKRVCCVCDVCEKVRWVRFDSYRDVCFACSVGKPTPQEVRDKISKTLTGRHAPEEVKQKISVSLTGRTFSDEHCRNLSIGAIGQKRHPATDYTRAKMSKSQKERKRSPCTDEARQHMSAGQQGIPYEEWTGFTERGGYCELFDDACRERIRAKYGHRCYICDKPQKENVSKNGNVRRLSVHHIDRNRNQGCNGVLWKLIPLCMHCHPGAHKDPIKSRLEYLSDDEEV